MALTKSSLYTMLNNLTRKSLLSMRIHIFFSGQIKL
jgi:hypothetical protein